MKTFARLLLAIIFSPIWLPAYAVWVGIVCTAVLIINLVLFIGKGEIDKEFWDCIKKVATLRHFNWERGQ